MHEFHVGAVVVAPGLRSEGVERFRELGYGTHPDVLTSAELQRLLESPGPTGGFASKPSDEEYPERVLLVLDEPSAFALYIVASQAHQLVGQDVDTVSVLILAQPSADGAAARKLAEEAGIDVHWGASFKVDVLDGDALEVSYEDLAAKRFTREEWDMVVLCVDVLPPEGLQELASAAGIELTEDGWVKIDSGTATTRPGVFAAGCASGPKNIRSSLEEAQAAANAATRCLDPRLLDGSFTEVTQEAGDEAAAPPPEDMRAQIEQLLHTLLER